MSETKIDMSYLYKTAQRIKNSVLILRWLNSKERNARVPSAPTGDAAYQTKLAAERASIRT